MNALLTDLYQLTMAAGYWEAGKTAEKATFEMFVRQLPWNRNFLIAAGLPQAVDYLLNLRFTAEEIDYLRTLPQFQHVSPGFFDYLRDLRFTGDLFAMREGTPLFGGEPVLSVRGPIIEAQIVETYLLSMVGFQTNIATKAARVSETAGNATVVEFGTRRAHSPEAGVLAGRAAYVGGCAGTSNVLTGMRFGIPVYGTAAHSWVLSFASELQAFRQLQKLLGEGTVYLIDTYNTLEGAHRAASLGRPLWGVRLDSGNLLELSRAVRSVLDNAGLQDAKIMATGDLNEYRILELIAARAPIDSFGVGTDLAASADCPAIGAVYKLVELEVSGIKRFTAKYSENKNTVPGAKQIFRYEGHDVIACQWECPTCPAGSPPAEALLKPVITGGKLCEPLPTATQAREHCLASLRALPLAARSLYPAVREVWRVEYSRELQALGESVRRNLQGATA